MGKMYKTSKGQLVDMDALRITSEKSTAVGNMDVNGRGDKLGRGGEVTDTVAKQTRAYHRATPKVTKNVSIKEDLAAVVEMPKEGLESIEENMPAPKTKAKAKKVVKKDVKTISKTKEVELEDGSIQIIEGDDDETPTT